MKTPEEIAREILPRIAKCVAGHYEGVPFYTDEAHDLIAAALEQVERETRERIIRGIYSYSGPVQNWEELIDRALAAEKEK